MPGGTTVPPPLEDCSRSSSVSSSDCTSLIASRNLAVTLIPTVCAVSSKPESSSSKSSIKQAGPSTKSPMSLAPILRYLLCVVGRHHHNLHPPRCFLLFEPLPRSA